MDTDPVGRMKWLQGAHGKILRYFCTISPLSFIKMSVLYGTLAGCSSWRSPVSEKTPHTCRPAKQLLLGRWG